MHELFFLNLMVRTPESNREEISGYVEFRWAQLPFFHERLHPSDTRAELLSFADAEEKLCNERVSTPGFSFQGFDRQIAE